jgi:branched-chain amino acid transport system substrate-binding protein
MSPTAPSRLLVLLAALALALAACGAPDDDAAQGDDPNGATEAPGASGSFSVGYLLPETGPLVALGPAQISAVELAVQDINEAGGVLGGDVSLSGADEAGDMSVASEGVSRLLSEDVSTIIGPVSSAISLGVIDSITGAGRTQCSGSNTSRTFTDYDDDGYYFRTVPSNVLQAPILAEVIVGDGHQRIGILQRADDYGESIGEAVADVLREQGAEVVAQPSYDADLEAFDAEVDQVLEEDPDAVLIIAFDEGARLLQLLLEAGYSPEEGGVYATDGVSFGDLAERVDPGNPAAISGLKGTAASSSFDPTFNQRLEDFAPELETTTFAPYFYDCVILMALAAEAAQSADPAVFRDEVVALTREGTECSDYEECVELLRDGNDIDYVGKSGPLNFSEVGEPRTALYDVVELDDEGAVEVLETREYSDEGEL